MARAKKKPAVQELYDDEGGVNPMPLDKNEDDVKAADMADTVVTEEEAPVADPVVTEEEEAPVATEDAEDEAPVVTDDVEEDTSDDTDDDAEEASEDAAEEVVPLSSDKDVTELISNVSTTDEAKQALVTIMATGGTKYSLTAAMLLDYNNNMSKNMYVETGVNNQYNFYNFLMSILDQADYKTFKIKFDIVNFAYRTYREEAMNELKVSRFLLDDNWKWGDSHATTFRYLNKLIIELLEEEERELALGKMNVNKILHGEQSEFSKTAIKNLTKYYHISK